MNQRELPGVAVRPFAGTANRRIGLVCRITYSRRNELDLLAGLVIGHVPGRALAMDGRKSTGCRYRYDCNNQIHKPSILA